MKKLFGGRVHFFGIGGAKVDRETERFMREAHFPYAIGYGLTETAPLIYGSAPRDTKLQMVHDPQILYKIFSKLYFDFAFYEVVFI